MNEEDIIRAVTGLISNPQVGDKFAYGYRPVGSTQCGRVCVEWDGEKWVILPAEECDWSNG